MLYLYIQVPTVLLQRNDSTTYLQRQDTAFIPLHFQHYFRVETKSTARKMCSLLNIMFKKCLFRKLFELIIRNKRSKIFGTGRLNL